VTYTRQGHRAPGCYIHPKKKKKREGERKKREGEERIQLKKKRNKYNIVILTTKDKYM